MACKSWLGARNINCCVVDNLNSGLPGVGTYISLRTKCLNGNDDDDDDDDDDDNNNNNNKNNNSNNNNNNNNNNDNNDNDNDSKRQIGLFCC